MNVTLKKGDASRYGQNLAPGCWGKDEDGCVWVRCPHEDHADKRPRLGIIHVGKPAERNWNIDNQGNVTPSIFFTEAPCGWHVFAKLEGWQP